MGLYWLMLQFFYDKGGTEFGCCSVYYGDFCVIVINGWMTKKVFMETVQYQTLLDCAQVGWWETDFEAGCYICSDYLDWSARTERTTIIYN